MKEVRSFTHDVIAACNREVLSDSLMPYHRKMFRRFFNAVVPYRIATVEYAVSKIMSATICDVGIKHADICLDHKSSRFHVLIAYFMLILIGISAHLQNEGITINPQRVMIRLVSSLMPIASDDDLLEKYNLAHVLMKKFIDAGKKAREWMDDLWSLELLYIGYKAGSVRSDADFSKLFNKMFDTFSSAVELPK